MNPHTRPVKVFCIPHAGGSEVLYRNWTESQDENLTFIPVLLPGRGRRFFDKPCHTMVEFVADVLETINRQLGDGDPFALFGHSMGAMISYEVARFLRRQGLPLPCHLFLSAAAPPHHPCTQNLTGKDNDTLIPLLVKLGGIPAVLLEEPEVLSRLLPVLLRDYKIVEAWTGFPEPGFEVPITTLAGNADDFAQYEHIREWETYTPTINHHLYSGGHFFLNEHRSAIISMINETLKAWRL